MIRYRRRIEQAFDRRRALTKRSYAAEARLWARFCADSPRGICEAIERGAITPRQANDHRAGFPRDHGGRRLRISRADQWLLGAMSPASPRSFVDLIRARHMLPHAWYWGDLSLFARALDWTEGDDPFVARQLDDSGRSPFTRSRFLLTKRGARLLREGIDDLSALPPLFVGGHQVYDARAPWVVRSGVLTKA